MVFLVRPDGTLTTIAGETDSTNGRAGFGGDGDPATAAVLNTPRAVAFAPDGAAYIADTMNNRVRRIGPDGVITTVAGTGERDENGDGGPASRAALIEPDHLVVADDGALWVTSAASTRVRRIDRSGAITTPVDFAEAGADPSATPAGELGIAGRSPAVDPEGTVYVDGAGQTIQAVSSDRARTAFDTTGGGPGRQPPLRHAAAAPLPGRGGGPGPGRRARVDEARGRRLRAERERAARRRRRGPGRRGVHRHRGRRVRPRRRQAGRALAPRRLRGGDSDRQVTGIAVGPDRTLYVALSEHEVVAVKDGQARRFAGVGDDSVVEDDIGDGGPATEAVLRHPSDVALTSDGSVPAVSAGRRRARRPVLHRAVPQPDPRGGPPGRDAGPERHLVVVVVARWWHHRRRARRGRVPGVVPQGAHRHRHWGEPGRPRFRRPRPPLDRRLRGAGQALVRGVRRRRCSRRWGGPAVRGDRAGPGWRRWPPGLGATPARRVAGAHGAGGGAGSVEPGSSGWVSRSHCMASAVRVSSVSR